VKSSSQYDCSIPRRVADDVEVVAAVVVDNPESMFEIERVTVGRREAEGRLDVEKVESETMALTSLGQAFN
jgi:hypothetical protein